MLASLFTELSHWRDAVRARFDPRMPPVLGWAVPYLGCGLQLALGGPAWLLAQHRRIGSPLTLYLRGLRITVCQDPDFQQRFYMADVDDVSFFEGLRALPGFSDFIILGASGPEGQNVGMDVLRQHLPARVLASAAALDDETAAVYQDELASGQAELVPMMRRLIIRATALLLCGPRLARDATFVSALCDFDDAILATLVGTAGRRGVERGIAARTRVLDLLEDELRRRAPGTNKEDADILDALASARDADGRAVAPRAIATEVFGYLFGSIANTYAAAAMCLLHVLCDPALRRRVQAELDAARAPHGDALHSAALRDLPVLNATYHETLRCYTPGLQLRMARRPMRAGDYELPAGSMVAFSAYLLHHDPALYSDPEVFDADRYLEGPRLPARPPSNKNFLSYGRGLHACLGRHLARQEILLATARLLRDYEVTLAPCDDPLAHTFLTNGVAAPKGPRVLSARRRAA